MLKAFVITFGLALVATAQAGREFTGHSATSLRERILQSDLTSGCLWDGTNCALGDGFLAELPSVLGSPTTPSAKTLSDASVRAVACSNYLSKPDCLAALSYSCIWNSALNSCGLADLLDVNDMVGLAYCPGSLMESAVNCSLLSGNADACSSSPYNCTATTISSVFAASGSTALISGLGDRLFDMVANTMMGMMVKSVSAADQLTSALISLVSSLPASVPFMSTTQVCVPGWMADMATVSGLAQAVAQAVKNNGDVASLLLGPQLLGSCAGVQKLGAAVAACTQAPSQSVCDTLAGCGWRDGAQACAAGSDLLTSLALDPEDSWVELLEGAQQVCRAADSAASCAAYTTVDLSDIVSEVNSAVNNSVTTTTTTASPPPSGGSGSVGAVPEAVNQPVGSSGSTPDDPFNVDHPGSASALGLGLPWWGLVGVSLAVVVVGVERGMLHGV